MPVVKGKGYTVGGAGTTRSERTARTAVPRLQEIGKGRPAPDEKHLPWARLMEIKIFIGEGVGGSTDTTGARDEVLDSFDDWRNDPDNKRFKVLDFRFEFVTENKLAMYVIYSK